jgi:hypothetical protein
LSLWWKEWSCAALDQAIPAKAALALFPKALSEAVMFLQSGDYINST